MIKYLYEQRAQLFLFKIYFIIKEACVPPDIKLCWWVNIFKFNILIRIFLDAYSYISIDVIVCKKKSSCLCLKVESYEYANNVLMWWSFSLEWSCALLSYISNISRSLEGHKAHEDLSS